MRSVLGELLRRTTAEVAIRTGWAQRNFASQHKKIRVLTYHGLIPDELADRPWVPSRFVTVSQFEQQMALLAEHGPVPLMNDTLERILNGDDLQGPKVCITFDDGTSNSIECALPILNRHGHQATFFLATGYIDRHELLPNDVIRILGDAYRSHRLNGHVDPICRQLFTEPDFNKHISQFAYRRELYNLWRRWDHTVDPDAICSLKIMSWDDARTLRDAGMEVGAHTVNHVTLSQEDRPSRWCEMADSIESIQEELQQEKVPFAYPNGQPEDYDTRDVEKLASLDVPYAVTQQPGWITTDTPRLELRRNTIGRYCTERGFLAQVFGLRDTGPDRDARQSA